MLYERIEKKTKNAPLLISILLNLLAVIIIFLLFEPTMKSDDYDMCNLLYGGVNGQYESQLLYSSIIWGKMMVGLLHIFPSIAWYAILQYILIICAMIWVDVILLKRNKNYGTWLFGLALFLTYEFMIRLTFSKTAGILMIAGYIVLLNAIEHKRKYVDFLGGVFFLFMGMIIRLSMNYFLMVSVIFFGAVVLSSIKLKDKKQVLKQMVTFGCVGIALLTMCWGITKYSLWHYGQDEKWEDYLELNSARASVVDYIIPDYETYESGYKDLGISYNDYTMWFVNANRGDSERLTQNLYKRIAGLIPKNEASQNNFLISAIRNLFNYLESNTVTFVFGVVMLACFLIYCRWNFITLAVMMSDFIFCYVYMMKAGRTQHHIDAVLMLGVVFVVLYFADFSQCQKKTKVGLGLATILVGITFCNVFSSELLSNSYYGNALPMPSTIEEEHYKNNYRDNSLLSNDKEHLYVVEAADTNTTYPCFLPLQVIEKKFYSNIYRQNMNHIKIYEDELKKYNIDNLYAEITDSDVIYYVTSKYTDQNKNVMLEYIWENYNPNAKIQLVMQLDQLNIYQFYEEYDLSGETTEVSDDTFDIQIDEKRIDNMINISGYAYQDDTNSYLEKVYIKLINENDETSRWYMATLSRNDDKKESDLYHGLYSQFESVIELPENETGTYSVEIYLENQNGLFLLK